MTEDEIRAIRERCERVRSGSANSAGFAEYVFGPGKDAYDLAAADVPRLLAEVTRLKSGLLLASELPDHILRHAIAVGERDMARAEVEKLRAIDASNVGDMITLSDINATLRAEIERMRVWLLWTRTRLLDNGRGETSLLGIANVLAGIERCLEGEAVDAALAKETR
jgi:hypothetical protein